MPILIFQGVGDKPAANLRIVSLSQQRYRLGYARWRKPCLTIKCCPHGLRTRYLRLPSVEARRKPAILKHAVLRFAFSNTLLKELSVANRLKLAKIHAILGLHQQGWLQRRIAEELGVRGGHIVRWTKKCPENWRLFPPV